MNSVSKRMRHTPAILLSAYAAFGAGSVALEFGYGKHDAALFRLSMVAALAVFACVGFLVVSRRADHPIGWIYLVGAVASGLGGLASAITHVSRSASGGLPGAAAVTWVSAVLGVVPLLVLIAFPLLLFPDGALLSRRWRPVMWAAVAAVTFVGAYPAFTPGRFEAENRASPVNPLGIPGAKAVLQALNGIGLLMLGLVVVAEIVSLFVRFRRASGAQREQLKWLAWAGLWTIVLLFLSGPGTYGGVLPDVVLHVISPVVPFFFGAAISLIPLGTGVAILRYHLWDIDRIVSRTVSYILVTGVLVTGYVGFVVLFEQASRPLTGSSDLAVAASTLIVAAAFIPLRRRIQAIVDRRFNRARYDMSAMIEAFSSRLRDEIEMDTLKADLETVVHLAMEPAHVALWVREETR